VRRSGLSLWMTRLAWGLLLLDLLLILIVPADASFDNLLLLIAYTLWLILSLIAIATWLIIRYRHFFRGWLGWSTPIIALVLSDMVFQGKLTVSDPNLSLFLTLLFVVSIWSVGVATAILLYYHDVGLGLMAGASAMTIWILLFAWRFQGNLIELVFLNLVHPDEPSPLWWFNPIMCIVGWIFPLGGISFLVHTGRLIMRELR
jgi:hypothetical protein